MKVFNLGDLNGLVNRFSFLAPGDYEEFSLDFKEEKFYTADYSTPISLAGEDDKIELHPYKALIYLTEGFKRIH